MKNSIKAILFLLVFVLISFPSFSQFKAGIRVGLNLANIRQNMKDADDEMKTVPRLLYSVGPCFDIGFGDWVSLQPALLLSAKGMGVNVDKEFGSGVSGYDRYTINYLEVPINVAFKFKGFQVYAGPYFAFALSGTNRWDIKSDEYSDKDSETIKLVMNNWDSDESDASLAIKRLDYGLNLGVGYKLGPVLFNAGLSLGLANLTPDDTADPTYNPKDYKVSTLTGVISVSYFFGKWK